MYEFKEIQEQVVPDFAEGAPDPDTELLKEALRVAFAKRKKVANVKGWLGERADECRIGEEAFKKIVYGHAPPSAAKMLRIFKHFGPAFASEILAHIGMECAWSHQVTAVQDAKKLTRLEADARNAMRLLQKALGE